MLYKYYIVYNIMFIEYLYIYLWTLLCSKYSTRQSEVKCYGLCLKNLNRITLMLLSGSLCHVTRYGKLTQSHGASFC